MNSEERIETLMQLGLTLNQARTYLALVQSGPTTAKETSKNTHITRQDIYRVIPELQKTGIVEKQITTPTIYKATPIEQAISILLKHKIAEQKELQRKTEELLHDVKDNHAEIELQEEDSQFVIVPGKEIIVQRVKEALQKAQTSVDVVTSQKRFSRAILEFAANHKKALKRGVKIRVATEKHVAEHTALEILRTLQKNPHFEVKYFPGPPEAIVSIIDMKQAMITSSATAHLAGTSALWSNNTSFIALAQNYFENKWNNSLEEKTR